VFFNTVARNCGDYNLGLILCRGLADMIFPDRGAICWTFHINHVASATMALICRMTLTFDLWHLKWCASLPVGWTTFLPILLFLEDWIVDLPVLKTWHIIGHTYIHTYIYCFVAAISSIKTDTQINNQTKEEHTQ